MQIQVLIHKIISGAVNRKVVCFDLPVRPAAGHGGDARAGRAELWHICVFIELRGGGEVKQYLQLTCFQEEREIEFIEKKCMHWIDYFLFHCGESWGQCAGLRRRDCQ